MRVCNHVNDPCIESVNFLHNIAYQNILLMSIFRHGLTMALFLHCSCSFSRILPQYWSIQFYLSFTKTRVAFPVWLSALTCNDMTFLPVKTRPAKSNCHRQIEICFANLFDALVLIAWHYTHLLLLYFKLLSCKNARGRSDINSSYRIKTCWHDATKRQLYCFPMKEVRWSSRVRYIVIVSL